VTELASPAAIGAEGGRGEFHIKPLDGASAPREERRLQAQCGWELGQPSSLEPSPLGVPGGRDLTANPGLAPVIGDGVRAGRRGLTSRRAQLLDRRDRRRSRRLPSPVPPTSARAALARASSVRVGRRSSMNRSSHRTAARS
jgi:hypothetical protein